MADREEEEALTGASKVRPKPSAPPSVELAGTAATDLGKRDDSVGWPAAPLGSVSAAPAVLAVLVVLSVLAYTAGSGRNFSLGYLRLLGPGSGGSFALPPEELVTIGQSSYTCLPAETPVQRVCNYQSLVLFDDELYYVSEDPAAVQIPPVDTHYLNFRGKENFGVGGFLGMEVRSPRDLPWGNATVPARVLDNVYLWNMAMGDNMGHAVTEELASLHNSMCKYLGSCTYAQRNEQHVLLFDRSRVIPAIDELLSRCMSRQPAYKLRQWSDLPSSLPGGKGVVLLRNVTAGMGPDCRAMGECRQLEEGDSIRHKKRPDRMPPEMMLSFRQRVVDCFGIDGEAEASLAPLRVLILDRRFESGRHFANIWSIQRSIRTWLPEADVRVEYMEDHPTMEQQLRVVHWASILLMMHGAALGHWVVLPRKAVGIHVVPHPDSDRKQKWATRLVQDLALTNVSVVGVTNSKPALMLFHSDRLQQLGNYWRLNTTQRLDLLERGKCPPGGLGSFCIMYFVNKSVHLDLDLGQLEAAMRQAVAGLLAKFPPEASAHIKLNFPSPPPPAAPPPAPS